MKIYNIYFFVFIILSSFILRAQNISPYNNALPKKYREDQFYVGLVYSVSLNLPADVFQNNLSYGIHLGFIRDMPLNKHCNRAIGVGVGYATNSNYSNLQALKDGNGNISYSLIGDGSVYSVNKIETHTIDIPLELRWRTSTYDSYNFWRIYFGFKTSYVFFSRSKLVQQGRTTTFSNPDVNSWQYSVYATFNFKGKWNIFIDYSLNTLMKSGIKIKDTNYSINTRNLNLGIRFYIL